MRSRWTDERLDELAETLRPLPAQGARLDAGVDHLSAEVRILRDDIVGIRGEVTGLRGEVTGLRGEVTGLRGEMTALRLDVSATQRQVAHIGWGLAVALLANVAALVAGFAT